MGLRLKDKKKEETPNAKPYSSLLREDPYEFLWAVSYTDFLMVLVAFFVVYFNFSDVAMDNTVDKIVQVLKSQLSGDVSFSRGNGTGEGQEKGASLYVRPSTDVISEIELKQLGKQKQAVQRIGENGIIIDFAEDLFRVGSFELSDSGRGEVARVLKMVTPYKDKLEMTFIGHTDDSPYKQSASGLKIIDTNFVLSNMRAAKAVQLALQDGFDPRWVSAQGVGEHSRHSRTLSLRITERKTQW